jgi:hypothetical protein
MNTPVRALFDRATSFIPRPRSALCSVINHNGKIAGLYFGSPEIAWAEASRLSSQLHIIWKEKPFHQVLSVMPEQYDDLWTGAKGMYKVEPIVEDGGEVIIYAPHIHEISKIHGKLIQQVGYHVLDYFLKQWEQFSALPRGILAHSTHLRGLGTYENGIEKPRISVTLASGISKQICQSVNLGYQAPTSIDVDRWSNRENEGILLVHKAGEVLYRLSRTK